MPICGRGVRTLTGGRSVWRARVAVQASLARRVVAQASFSCRCATIHLLAPYGVESLLLTLIWKWAAAGKRHLLLREKRALKDGVVIRKWLG